MVCRESDFTLEYEGLVLVDLNTERELNYSPAEVTARCLSKV